MTSFLAKESIKFYERNTSTNRRYLSQSRGEVSIRPRYYNTKILGYSRSSWRALYFPAWRIKNMAIILNSMDTKDRRARDIHILSCILAGVRKYFRRVYQRDMFLSAVDSDAQPFYSHVYGISPAFYQQTCLSCKLKTYEGNIQNRAQSNIFHRNLLKFNWTTCIQKETNTFMIKLKNIFLKFFRKRNVSAFYLINIIHGNMWVLWAFVN